MTSREGCIIIIEWVPCHSDTTYPQCPGSVVLSILLAMASSMGETTDHTNEDSSVHEPPIPLGPLPFSTAVDRLRILRQNLQLTRTAIKQHTARATSKRMRARPRALTQRAKEIACIIYDIEQPCRAKAEEYLLRQMRNRGVLEEACIDEVREELNSEYHGASNEERARWRNPLTPAEERRRKEALQFLSEFSLHGWVRHSNEALGKAPTSAQVATKYSDLVQGVARCDQNKNLETDRGHEF